MWEFCPNRLPAPLVELSSPLLKIVLKKMGVVDAEVVVLEGVQGVEMVLGGVGAVEKEEEGELDFP